MSKLSKGAIAAGDPQTVAAGVDILEQGGNAVDAAVAAAFASFVAEFPLVNIGGSGIGMVVDSRSDQAVTYDFFSTMPSDPLIDDADFRQILLDFGPEQQAFHIGRASVAIPGAVAGLCAMAEEKGTLPLSTLLEPAIHLARKGVVLSDALFYAYNILQPILLDTPGTAAIYAPNGRPYQPGERLKFSRLAETLTQLGREGPDLFYRGAIAQAILADQRAYGGLITEQDLATYSVRRVRPIRVDYRDHTILLPPPASTGGVLIAFALNLLAHVNIGDLEHNSSRHIHILTEAMRLTNAARDSWEKSQGNDSERIQSFLSEATINQNRKWLVSLLIDGLPPIAEADWPAGSSDTTHISVVDEQGLLVSITTSAGEHAGFVVGDTGICLNNMLGEIDLHPNGFHNLPAGARLSTMMTPSVVLRNNEPLLAIGSGGSNRIRSAILQVISNVIDFYMPLEQAVDASRIHFESGLLQLEGGISHAVVDEFRRAGYSTNHWPEQNLFFGGAHAVAVRGENLIPVGDQRRGGSVAIVK